MQRVYAVRKNWGMVLAVSDGVRYLLFPLAVLLTGAVVTGLLIPWLARRRDDHRKALEVRTGLVSEISQTVMDFIMAIQFAVRVEVSQEPKEYDEAYKTWEVRSAVLGTKLEAYFAPSIAKDWDALEDQLRGLYNLTRTSDRVGREAPTNVLLAKLGLRRSEPPGDDRERQEAARRDAWERLRDPILDCKISLIQKVLEERVNELQKPPLLERLRRRIAA